MIRYDLMCEDGHKFDGWFSNSAAFDDQSRRGLVSCIHCGSTRIEKQLMAPGIPVKSNRKTEAPAKPMLASAFDPKQQKIAQLLRELRKTVEESSEYVCEKFAEEARKIHYEEAERRGIYGETTAEDAKELIEEGIEIHPLPILPEDGN
jgi:hypothetical protein